MRMILHSIIICLLVLALTACAENTYNRVETGGTARTDVRLDETLPVVITNVKDGGMMGKTSNHSGALVTRTVDASLSRYAKLVDVSPNEYQKPGDGRAGPYTDYGYIVVPVITAWEIPDARHENAPTQIRVKLTVIDAATNEKLSSDFLEATAPAPYTLSALVNRGSDKPSDMLSELVDDYVDALYGHDFLFF
jgi:hypothetical protein